MKQSEMKNEPIHEEDDIAATHYTQKINKHKKNVKCINAHPSNCICVSDTQLSIQSIVRTLKSRFSFACLHSKLR